MKADKCCKPKHYLLGVWIMDGVGTKPTSIDSKFKIKEFYTAYWVNIDTMTSSITICSDMVNVTLTLLGKRPFIAG